MLHPTYKISDRTLSHAGSSVSANVLLDTGSTVNLLPYDIGLHLGAIWEEQTVRLPPLTGNLARVEARGLFVQVQIGNLKPVRLAFAWAQTSQVPLVLGQTNFFGSPLLCVRCFYESSKQANNLKRKCSKLLNP